MLFAKYRDEFEQYCIMTCGQLGDPRVLQECFSSVSRDVLMRVVEDIGIRSGVRGVEYSKEVIVALCCERYGRWRHEVEDVENLPVYCTDLSMYDPVLFSKLAPSTQTTQDKESSKQTTEDKESSKQESLSLDYPVARLNLQFLGVQEYVYRLLQIYTVTAAIDQRTYIESIIQKSNPRYIQTNMLCCNSQVHPITNFKVTARYDPNTLK